MATDYNSKYSGEQIDALLDMVATSAGGVIVSQGIYIAPFDAGTVESIANNGSDTVFIPLNFIRAIIEKKRILIPFNGEFSNGYVVVIQADGYINEEGGSAEDAGVWLTFIYRNVLYDIYSDNTVEGGGITVASADVTTRQL